MTKISGNALSGPNLLSLKLLGGHIGSKDFLFVLLEFEAGVTKLFELQGPFRHMPYLVTYLQFRSAQRGRRCRTLDLSPPHGPCFDGPGNGIHELEIHEAVNSISLHLLQRFTGRRQLGARVQEHVVLVVLRAVFSAPSSRSAESSSRST